ncbi:MAG TPA: DUF3575 domain-containing protein [Flavitalea sp.]|nr:DUF3575 domain-containing protein [Flavitalea sp.]
MKKTLFVALALTVSLLAAAQHPKAFYYKWAPAGLYTGKITLGVEYNIEEKKSVEILIGFPKKVSKSVTYDKQSSDFEMDAFSLMAGYRMYFGRKTASGTYFQPYFKYLRHKAKGLIKGDLDGQTATFDSESNYKGYGVGGQLGVQFLIATRVSIDFFFLGPEANMVEYSSRLKDVANSLPWTFVQADEAEQDIRNAISDVPFIGKKMEVEVSQNDKTVSTHYKGFLPGFRIGATIGVRLGR